MCCECLLCSPCGPCRCLRRWSSCLCRYVLLPILGWVILQTLSEAAKRARFEAEWETAVVKLRQTGVVRPDFQPPLWEDAHERRYLRSFGADWAEWSA
jgi:hypothetical protein